jgi:hypothetical protein
VQTPATSPETEKVNEKAPVSKKTKKKRRDRKEFDMDKYV